MPDPQLLLRNLARRVADAHLAIVTPAAIMLTGSAATGACDGCSDLDVIMYHEVVPTKEALMPVWRGLGGTAHKVIIPASADAYGEQVRVDGVEVQVAHVGLAGWERDLDGVLARFELTPKNELQKALSGLLDGEALHGEPLIAGWQARAAAYPDGLARAMVEANLVVFPLWAVQPRVGGRDAVLWRHQILVEATERLLNVLAGLNRRYFSTFQPKRLGGFVGSLAHAPHDLANRLDRLFTAAPADAAADLERLVDEVADLVEAHLPAVDVAPMRRRLGERQKPWLA